MTGKLFSTNTETVLHHHSVRPPTPFWWAAKMGGRGRGWASDQIFKKGGLDRISNFREGCWKREEGGEFFQGWGVAGFT